MNGPYFPRDAGIPRNPRTAACNCPRSSALQRIGSITLLLCACLAAFTIPAAASDPPPDLVTARMLVEPNALMGAGPVNLTWSPQGALLAYVQPEDGRDTLWLYDAATGDRHLLLDPAAHSAKIDLSSVQWSPQGDALLLAGEDALWRLDVTSGTLQQVIAGGDDKTALMFLPSGKSVAFAQDNDLYTVAMDEGRVQRLTTDGSETIFNGTLDWVYNEELATRAAQPAYAWSPDERWLLYLRIVDDMVQQHPITDFRPIPPTVSYTRYPTAGSPNPTVSLHLLDFAAGQSPQAHALPENAEYILPFFTWTPDSTEVFYVTQTRDHKLLELKAWNATSGSGRTVIRETDPYWVNEDFYVAPLFLKDGRFLWLSERDGYMHLYLYSREGELIRQLTRGEWLIDTTPWDILVPGKPVYLDPSETWAYYSSTQQSPLVRQLYRVNLAGGEPERLTTEAGFHFASLSGDGQYLVDVFSNVDTPPVTSILQADGKPLTVLGQCAGPAVDVPPLTREFLTIEAHDGTALYAQIVKPADFDPSRKYGVVVHWYGGPGLQLVSNRYGSTNIFNIIERDVLYTQAGFIVWRLENRGAFGRGHPFEIPIAGQLGPAALNDQLAGIEYLQTLPYVDADRIGSDGHSFGGFLTLYALIHAPDVLHCGVDGSGPTDWRYYDTIYTERYMGTPAENSYGYAATEVISRVGALQVRPLLLHGLADTNVHLQNTVNLIQALESADKPYDFIALANEDHDYEGDGLATCLAESTAYFVQHLGRP